MGTLDQEQRYINLNYRHVFVPTNGGWTTDLVNGSMEQAPMEMKGRTTVAASSRALANCKAMSLRIGLNATSNVDWDRRMSIAFDIARVNSDVQILSRFQLKEAATEGVLAAKGIGIEIQNFTLIGEAYDVAREAVGLDVVMTDSQTYRVQIEHIPGKGVEFYVDKILRGISTREPSGDAGAVSRFVSSIINGLAGGVDGIFKVSNIMIIQEVEDS